MHPVVPTASSDPVITKMRKLTIGRLAEETRVNLETIRYYERIGLMPSPRRTEGGHRDYDPAHARQLAFIRRGRELGFSIDEIRALLALASTERGSCAEVREIATSHLLEVRAKLAHLRKLENILAETVAKCSGDSSPHCPVLDVLDAGAPAA